MEIMEYFAEKCGVTRNLEPEFEGKIGWSGKHYYFVPFGKQANIKWSIQDPRCREIIRERFGVHTNKLSSSGWICGASGYGSEFIEKTIAEAEIACLTAIWEAEK